MRGIDVKTVFAGQFSNLFIGILNVYGRQQAQEAALGLDAEDDVFGDGIVLDQLEMLVHHADVELGGMVRRRYPHLLATDPDLALVRLVHTEQHTHQR